MLSSWGLDGSWSLLRQGGAADIHNEERMLFARRVLVSESAYLFMTGETRFSAKVYALVYLVACSSTDDTALSIIRSFRRARACCVGFNGIQLRSISQTESSYQTAECLLTLKTLFTRTNISTFPVECEHHVINDDCFSMTTCVHHAVIGASAVARHTHTAYTQVGGKSQSLPPRRVSRASPSTCTCLILQDMQII